MMLRLDQLLETDSRSRWRIIFVSAAAIAIWGILSELRGVSVHEAQVNATICGAVIFVLQVSFYCARSAKSQIQLEWIAAVPRRLVMTAAAVFVLAMIPAPRLEAAILDRRLRALTRDKNLSPEQAKEVGSALDVAAMGRIKLPDSTRVQVYQALKGAGLAHPDSAPIVESANSLVRYTREVTFAPAREPKAVTGSTEARDALRLGSSSAMSVLSGPPTVPTARRDDAAKAVSELTRAIELANGQDRDILIGARTMRALMYLYLLNPTNALEDAEALEAEGGTDLSNVLAIEGTALFMRGGRDDLERSIRIFTLITKLDAPTWESSDPRQVAALRIDAFGNRGKAYYKLGEYQKCIEDTQRLLDLISESQRTLGLPYDYYLKNAYLAIISSYLQLGNVEQAKKNAEAWLAKSGDPIARRVVAEMESGRFNREGWLKEYMEIPEQ
jgi:hypothetical protein